MDKKDLKQIAMIIVGLALVAGLGTLASSIGGVVWTIFCIVFIAVLVFTGLLVTGALGSIVAAIKGTK